MNQVRNINSKYYKKLPNGQWKVYIQRFADKQTGKFLYVKPGISRFWDADARMYFNNLFEEISFKDKFNTKCIVSKIFPSRETAELMEEKLLKHFGKEISIVELGFKTPGYTEVRKYNQLKVNKAFNIINDEEEI
jgi:hypothetical protein